MGMDMPNSPQRALSVLVLDGQYCHALAAIRSLGRRGVRVSVASNKSHPMGFASRFCARTLASPAPNLEPERYVDWLLETLRRQRYDATLFFGESTADLISRHRDSVQKHTGCPLPTRELFLTADRKDRVTRLARQLGVPTPETHELESFEALETVVPTLRFPAVVKGVYSSGSQQVAVVRDVGELRRALRRISALREDASLPLPVVQEFVPGRGYGLTALVRRGEPIAVFMHRRIAEHDVARGVAFAHGATGAESVYEPELLDAGLTLLKALCWDGMAMVEFKRDSRDGRFCLMEINPRFVGTLDLAIAAGVDFPWLYAQHAAGRPVAGPNRYRVGLKYRWLLSKNVADAFEHPCRYALGALSILRPDTRSDLCWRDPGPHWAHLRDAMWWTREHWRGAHRAPASAEPAPAGPAPEPPTAAVEELLSGSR